MKRFIPVVLGILLLWPPLPANARAANTASRSVIPLNGTVHGSLSERHRADTWDIALPRDGGLQLTLTKDPSLSAGMHLADFSSPSSFVALQSGNVAVYPQAGKGRYLVQVNWLGDGAGSYTVASVFTPNATPNDAHTTSTTKLASALPLAVNGVARGHLGYYLGVTANRMGRIFDDSDLYKLTLPSNGALTIAAKTDATLPAVRLELWNANGANISGDWGATGNPQLSRGTYYLNILRQDGGYNGNYGSYTLTSKFVPPSLPEYVAKPLDAKHAAPLSPGKIITGNLGYMLLARTGMGQLTYTDSNWFRVAVNGKGLQLRVDVAMEATLSSATIALYDPSGTHQIATSNGAGSAVLYQPTITPGTYLIAVTRADPGYSGNYGAYRLRVLVGSKNLQSVSALHLKG
jgi:hypothetical protein